MIEVNGIPAHPLLVHLVVVLLPLAALGAVLVSLWPAAQRKLTFLVPLAAVVGAAVVPVTTRAGTQLAAHLGNPAFLDHHRQLGNMVLPWAVALAVTTSAQWLLLRRTPGVVTRGAVALAVVASAVGTAAIVVLAGDAGAHAVWANR
ncbi:MAG TPA: DUF2231 domain-containing protein [Pedococcus sp.]|jgi:hypothetical protein